MDGNVDGDEKETTRPASLMIRMILTIAGLVAVLILGQLAG